MLTRRHIRIKVMQSVYAYNQSINRELETQEKFLNYSIEQMSDLYSLLLRLIVSVRDQAQEYMERSSQKFLATETEKNPSLNFINNKIVGYIADNTTFNELIEKRKLDYWSFDSEYVSILFHDLKEKAWYQEYLDIQKPTLKEDRAFVLQFYREVVAPNDKLYDYLEDKRLTWIDDFPIVNTVIVNTLEKINSKNMTQYLVPELYKHEDDRDFSVELLRKVILNEQLLNEEIKGRTPNWDQDRIAEIDMIILRMGIAEFLFFPSIPVRATINEYLEIAKEYSTPKSRIFINGILDKVVKEFTAQKRLNKVGRGLQEK
ncbi:MAG: transcription antitermination factor NusB [Bacteroidetes bacterium]|nr:transcription antitermination factor NusB [Bacteroidota bacterium]